MRWFKNDSRKRRRSEVGGDLRPWSLVVCGRDVFIVEAYASGMIVIVRQHIVICLIKHLTDTVLENIN